MDVYFELDAQKIREFSRKNFKQKNCSAIGSKRRKCDGQLAGMVILILEFDRLQLYSHHRFIS